MNNDNSYRIKWEIDIISDTPEHACQLAWEIMKEQENEASFLDVYDPEFPDDITGTMDMNEPETGVTLK